MKRDTEPKEFEFSSEDLFSKLPHLSSMGITEFHVHDKTLSHEKNALLEFMKKASECAGDVFFTVPVQASVLNREVIDAAGKMNCSLEIPLEGSPKGEGNDAVLLFDKKLYASKAQLLNGAELVFGFTMGYGEQAGDTFRSFRERLDFALSLYPNHIDFPQLYGNPFPKATGIFSSKDLDFARGMAFACKSFYSSGRAVPWFNTVISALKISPSQFFADFDEWEQCNSCSFDTGFDPEEVPHEELQKMQLKFLGQKFEEKNKMHFFDAASDLVRLNGAFSRLASDGTEETLETSYNPDDLLSPYAAKLSSFCENVTMERCLVRVFDNQGFPDYKIL